MADLDDLTTLLTDESSSLSDLDWLDVDEDDYRELERLPKQNLDAVPDLVAQWEGLGEADKYGLHAVNREPVAKNTPFWSEKSTGHLSDDWKEEVVEQFLRKHVMAGTNAKTAVSLLKQNFDREVLARSESKIRSVLAERGLLGNVYVDSELFPRCDQGDGQDFVRQNNKTAKFVIAKDKCSGCRWANDGRCSRFEKELVFDVSEIPYTKELWDAHRSRAESLGRDLSGISESLPVAEKIRQASLAPMKGEAARFDSKPVQKDVTAGLTSEEAFERLNSSDIRQEVVENVYRSRKIERYAKELLAGNHGPDVVGAISNDPDLRDLRAHVHLMGRLYADLSYFPNREAASEYLADRPEVYPVGSPRDEKTASDFDLSNPQIVVRIVERFSAVNSKELDEDLKSRLTDRLASMTPADLHGLAVSVFSKTLPGEVRQYAPLGIQEAHVSSKAPETSKIEIQVNALVREAKSFYDRGFDDEKIRKALSHKYGDRAVKTAAVYLDKLSSEGPVKIEPKKTAEDFYQAPKAAAEYNTTRGHYAATLDSARAEKHLGDMLKEAKTLLSEGLGEEAVRASLAHKYGPTVMKMGTVYLSQIVERTVFDPANLIDQATLNAKSGAEELIEMELLSQYVYADMHELVLDEPRESNSLDGVSFEGLVLDDEE